MTGSLTAGLPDLSQFGPQLLVPFGVRDLPQARVLWLNTRWFTQQGRPIGVDPGLRRQTESWVREQFGVSVGGDRTVHADRYGDPRGTSPHGGSGRVATIGRFQVKGIGRTPLVGDATWVHSHGQMSLTEAICEAIFGEVLDPELPYGAVPVIAIIDCGESMKTPQGELRRALIVRPAALRPAHLLRAASFVPSAGLAVAPSPDAMRVRDSIAHLASMQNADLSELHLPRDLAELLHRLARQAATADALRLFTGGMFASNVSLSGAILDFGVARALYSWASLQLHAHTQGFGHDVDRLVNFAGPIQFYARKAGCAGAPWFAPDIEPMSVRESYRVALREMFGHIWSEELLDADSRQLVRDATQEYFERQQQIRLREIWNRKRPNVDWVHDELTAEEPQPGLATTIRDVVRRHGGAAAGQSWRRAARLLLPRAELDRSRLERRVMRVLRDDSATDLSARVTRLVEGTIARCRRWWPDLPPGLSVTSQRVSQGCSALECVTGEDARQRWWLEGWRCESRFVWGSAELTDSQIKRLRPEVRGARWHCTVDLVELPDTIADQLGPTAHLRYAAPPRWWAG
jgi:hypothetical protein